MSAGFAQRALALGAAAFLAGTLAVAFVNVSAESSGKGALPQPAVGSWGGWSVGLAGVAPSVPSKGKRSACGWIVVPRTLGIVHPVLPCGAKIFLEFRGRRALTQVVAHGPVQQARELNLTPALAKLLRLEGVRELRWAFAR